MLSIFSKNNDRKQVSPILYLKPVMLGISQHSIESDPEERRKFRKTIDEIAESLTENSTHEDILVQIEVVVNAMEEYNRRATHTAVAYRNELRAILSLMTQTIIALGQSSKTGVEQLQAIEKNLESAVQLGETQLLRNKLTGTLTLIRNESARVRLETQNLIKSLKAAVVRAGAQTIPALAAMPPDPATGLAGPNGVQHLITKALGKGRTVSVALFLIEQIQALNSRLGRAVGDEALLTVSEYIAYEMAEYGALLRWNGPAFVLIADDSQANFDRFERRVKELTAIRFDREIQVGGQSVKLNLTFSWTVQSLRPENSVDDLLRRLDSFVSGRLG